MKRACDLKDEFATFYTSLELEQREELEENMKILLKKVVTNIDYVDEVTRLSEDFGRRFVELRSLGFRADYFAILADATIKECTHLDSAVHKAHTTTQAFSQFGALVSFQSFDLNLRQNLILHAHQRIQPVSDAYSLFHPCNRHATASRH
ncbi:unnamed protein product, partial [Cylicostephanus goldi]